MEDREDNKELLDPEIMDTVTKPYTGLEDTVDIEMATGLPRSIIETEIMPLIENVDNMINFQLHILKEGERPNPFVWLNILKQRYPGPYESIMDTYTMFLRQYKSRIALSKAIENYSINLDVAKFKDIVSLCLMMGLYRDAGFIKKKHITSQHWMIYLRCTDRNLQDVMDISVNLEMYPLPIIFMARYGVRLNYSALAVMDDYGFYEGPDLEAVYINTLTHAKFDLSKREVEFFKNMGDELNQDIANIILSDPYIREIYDEL